MMLRLAKLLSFYPVVLISGILLLVARVIGWASIIAFLLVAGFKHAGTLEVSAWIVGSLLAGGVITLNVADLCMELFARLNLAGGERIVAGRPR